MGCYKGHAWVSLGGVGHVEMNEGFFGLTKTTWRNTTGHTPYKNVYGNKVLLPIEFHVKIFRLAANLVLNLDEA